jgi:hypothetical protein
MVMSGVDDGKLITCSSVNAAIGASDVTGDGIIENGAWILRLGRRDDNDICISTDTYASRYHARLHWRDERWWLEDCNSRNGTFVEDRSEEARVFGIIPIEVNQLFCLGHTWLRIQPPDELHDELADTDLQSS